MKKLIAALILTLAVFSGSAALAAPWKLGHMRPAGTAMDESMKWFTEQVTERTNGKITFAIYPANQLGDYTVVQERTSIGDVEMNVGTAATAIHRELGVTNFPYLVSTWAQAREVYGPDGPMFKVMSRYLEKEDLKLLGIWPMYFGTAITSKPIDNPGDPNGSKGVKMRVPPIKPFEVTANQLGFQATPVPWADTFTAMQTGIVDGVIGAGAEGYYSNFRDLAKYYYPINEHFECHYLYINMDLWKSLSKKEQEILQTVARETVLKRWDVAEEAEKADAKKLADLGVVIHEFSEAELNAMRDKVVKNGWQQLFGEIPEALVKEAIGQ